MRALADGRIFGAKEALEAKLVDRIGYPHEALKRLKEMLGKGPYEVLRYEVEGSFMDLLRARLDLEPPKSVLAPLFIPPRAMYLYAPGFF